MGLLDAFQLGEALRLPFMHADLFLGELRGEAFGLGLFGECLALCDGEAAAELTRDVVWKPLEAVGCREIRKRGIAIPSLYAIGGKSCVRVCNLNHLSQRSDFEALVQACEEVGVGNEAQTGHKAVQHVKIRRCGTTMMLGTGQEILKRSPDE